MYKLIDFYSQSCGPCKMLKPILEKLAGENEHIDVQFIDVQSDEGQRLLERYGVVSVPTVKFIRDDVIVETVVGFKPGAAVFYENKFKEHFSE